MNKNELGRMLSEVDEKHVAEILEADETTSNVTVIRRRSTFGKWTAIAAAVCLCVVGGGVALGRMQGQTPITENPNSQVDMALEYDLIRESIPKELCVIDYTWEVGGENFKCSSPMLPFADSNFNEVRSTFFCDENGNAVNFYAHLKNDEKSVQLTISDRGHLFPNNFFVDLSGDADRQKPAIHIYDMTQDADNPKYELYYLYNGVGMSMETSGYTEEEAVDLAACLLENNVTSKSLWEATNSGFDYEVIRENLPEEPLDLSYTLEQENGNASTAYTPSLPYEMSKFASSSAITYLDSELVVHNTFVHLVRENGYVFVTLSDFGELFSTRVSPNVSKDSQYDKPIIHMYEHPVYESESSYELFCVYNGVGMSMETSGCTEEEAVAFAVALLKNNVTAATLYTDTMNSETKQEGSSDKSEYFRMDTRILPMLKGELDNVKTVYPLDDYSPPFDTSKYTFGGYSEVYCIGGDIPNHAVIYLASTPEKFIKLQMSQEEDMFGGVLFPENGGVDYRGITLYGTRSIGMEPQSILTFVMNDTGFTLRFQKLTDEEIFAIVDAIIDNHFTIQDLPLDENNTVSYMSLEELRTHEIFAFAAPEHAEIGELRLREDTITITRQPNTETDFPDIIHTCYYTYSNDDSGDSISDTAKFLFCSVKNALAFTEKNSTPMDASTITQDSVRSHGQPSINGRYSFDFIIPMGEYYYEINANCTAEEMWAFLEDILHK